MDKWDEINSNGLILKSIFENLSEEFFKRVDEYNKIGYQHQSTYIDKIINIIHNKPSWEELEVIFNEQTEKAIEWCQNYNLSINLESYFYQKYNFIKNNEKSKQTQKYKDYIKNLDNYFGNFIGYI